MIWPDEISFDGFTKKINEWYKDKDFELGDPPISAQFALDLIFKTLVDDKENYPYLTTMSESTEQTNSIMLDLILRKYSRKYRKYCKKIKKGNERRIKNEYVRLGEKRSRNCMQERESESKRRRMGLWMCLL